MKTLNPKKGGNMKSQENNSANSTTVPASDFIPEVGMIVRNRISGEKFRIVEFGTKHLILIYTKEFPAPKKMRKIRIFYKEELLFYPSDNIIK